MSYSQKRYDYLDHTADVRFRAYGHTKEQAFESAAEAMFNSMINLSAVECRFSKDIVINASGIDELLVDWLSELLFIFEVEFIIFGNFNVNSITEDNGEYKLSATVCGENIDLSKHDIDTQIKAVTYNHLVIEEDDHGAMVQITVDV